MKDMERSATEGSEKQLEIKQKEVEMYQREVVH
jgi:hypothetical protein